MSVPIAFSSALVYGVADFTGGLAAKKAPVKLVTLVSQSAGMLALMPAVFLVAGVITPSALGIGAGSGLAGTAGLLLYLRGLAVGPMGVIAPLSAVISAGLPLLVGLLGGERLGPVTLVAILVALAAIVLAQAGTAGDRASREGLLLGLGAGAGFGLFFAGMDAAPDDSGLWPLLAGRIASVTVLGVILLLTSRLGAVRGLPVPLMILSGLCDTGANVLFLVATRLGDLGISAVVVSLYPVVVVLLARVVLRERLTGIQLASAGMALGASALLAAGG